MDGPSGSGAAADAQPKENGIASAAPGGSKENGKLTAAQKKKLQKKRRKQERRQERQVCHGACDDAGRCALAGAAQPADRPPLPAGRRCNPSSRRRAAPLRR